MEEQEKIRKEETRERETKSLDEASQIQSFEAEVIAETLYVPLT